MVPFMVRGIFLLLNAPSPSFFFYFPLLIGYSIAALMNLLLINFAVKNIPNPLVNIPLQRVVFRVSPVVL